jgi:hypothetical protein
MNDLTFGTALLSMFVTLVLAVAHELTAAPKWSTDSGSWDAAQDCARAARPPPQGARRGRVSSAAMSDFAAAPRLFPASIAGHFTFLHPLTLEVQP